MDERLNNNSLFYLLYLEFVFPTRANIAQSSFEILFSFSPFSTKYYILRQSALVQTGLSLKENLRCIVLPIAFEVWYNNLKGAA